MANKTYAKEWLSFAIRNLNTAKLLYPNPNYCLPQKEEIKKVLDFTEELFDKVCDILGINRSEFEI